MLQTYIALPVSGPTLSVRAISLPDGVNPGVVLLQLRPPTVQVNAEELQPREHACMLKVLVPLLQVDVAVPVSGPVESMIEADWPLIRDGTEAEQVRPPTVQVAV